MAIPLDRLSRAAARPRRRIAKSLTEARRIGTKTAFLCHSHQDADYVEGLVVLLAEEGWDVYIDWQDETLPAKPNSDTAAVIRNRIAAADYFMFLATPNAVASRWCPWEIGYADGVKSNDQIFIIPTQDSSGRYFGNEYLQLYRRIDFSTMDYLASWYPGESQGVLVKSL